MNSVKVIIVEDEPIIAADLEIQLSKADINVMACLDDGQDVLDYLQDHSPDVILMDIKIHGELDGIDVANQVHRLYQTPIIFLTSNTDMATFNRAKLSFPYAFLSKPFRIRDILHAIELALNTSGNSSENEFEFLPDRIFIKSKDSLDKVLYEDILLIKADGAYTRIMTKDKEYVHSQTLKIIEEKIVAENFFRVHRSYVVNLKNVDKITEGHLNIDKYKIPVSRRYRDKLYSLLRTL